MVGGRPGPRGDLSSVTDPAHYPSSYDTLINKTIPSLMLWNGTAVGDTVTTDIPVGNCLGWTVYASGTGDWNVEAAPHNNNNESFWTELIGTDVSGDGFYESVGYHPHVRVVVRNGSNLIIWIYRRYATF